MQRSGFVPVVVTLLGDLRTTPQFFRLGDKSGL